MYLLHGVDLIFGFHKGQGSLNRLLRQGARDLDCLNKKPLALYSTGIYVIEGTPAPAPAPLSVIHHPKGKGKKIKKEKKKHSSKVPKPKRPSTIPLVSSWYS